MDKFDEIIKESQESYEPRSDFVDSTMDKVLNAKPKRHWNLKLWAPVLAGGLVAIALVVMIVPSGGSQHKLSNLEGQTKPRSSSSSLASNTSATPAVPAGSDNASLNNDLNTISSSINQENTDQSAATSTINDASQEITVPTD